MKNQKPTSLWSLLIVVLFAGTLYAWSGPRSERNDPFEFTKIKATSISSKLGERLLVGEAQDLPQAPDPLEKYGEISSLPMEKRRAAFSNASPKNRSDFVRIHLALYLARHAQLNEDQKQVILEGMALATPEQYDIRPDNSDRIARTQESLREFSKRIVGVFAQEEAARVFATLGAPAPDDLLQKYKDFSTLPMADRRTTFSKAPAKDRSDLMRTHLALYLARHAELTQDQKQVILEGMALATPEQYEARSNDPGRSARLAEALRQFTLRIRALFTQEEAARIFATLGTQEPENELFLKLKSPDSSDPPMAEKMASVAKGTPKYLKDRSDLRRTNSALSALNVGDFRWRASRLTLLTWPTGPSRAENIIAQGLAPYCECAYWDYYLNWCGLGKVCKLSSNCEKLFVGCGTLLLYECDGKCKPTAFTLTTLSQCESLEYYWNTVTQSCQEDPPPPVMRFLRSVSILIGTKCGAGARDKEPLQS